MRAWRIVCLALGGLRRTPLRATLTALGVAIASGALVSMVAFALGLQRQIETPVRLLSLLNDIHVTPKAGGQAEGATALDDAAVDRLARVPGVAAAFPNIRIRGIQLRRGDKTETCLAMGMPREATLWGVAEEILVAGRFFTEGRRPEAILGCAVGAFPGLCFLPGRRSARGSNWRRPDCRPTRASRSPSSGRSWR